MARYASLVGKRVEVLYRCGEIYLPATGTLAADSGRSIFLEDVFEKNSRKCMFRWEIPYQFIVRVNEAAPPEERDEEAAPAGRREEHRRAAGYTLRLNLPTEET
jgi:hypothetical protein